MHKEQISCLPKVNEVMPTATLSTASRALGYWCHACSQLADLGIWWAYETRLQANTSSSIDVCLFMRAACAILAPPQAHNAPQGKETDVAKCPLKPGVTKNGRGLGVGLDCVFLPVPTGAIHKTLICEQMALPTVQMERLQSEGTHLSILAM